MNHHRSLTRLWVRGYSQKSLKVSCITKDHSRAGDSSQKLGTLPSTQAGSSAGWRVSFPSDSVWSQASTQLGWFLLLPGGWSSLRSSLQLVVSESQPQESLVLSLGGNSLVNLTDSGTS